MHEDASESDNSIHQVIKEVEEQYFIGRANELKFFHDYIQIDNPAQKVIHFYGEGGIGKTYLIKEFARIANKHHIPFIHLDSQDFTHNEQGFIDYLYSTILFFVQTPTESIIDQQITLHDCVELINNYGKKIIIAIDTYEHMTDLDRWLRNVFIRQLHQRISIILAGRKPLASEWLESPAWRRLTYQCKINPFNREETKHYLQLNGMTDESNMDTIWEYTKGHPLLITLATISDFTNEEENFTNQNNTEILSTLTKRWLSEVTDERLINILEVAALFHQFDQNCLSEILNQEIPNSIFNQLISLSFVRKTRRGWGIHELIRDAIRIELKQRNPDRHELITKKIIQYYYHRIIKHKAEEDIASFFYHIGDDVIQSVFFQDAYLDTSMYLEPIGEYNFHEVEDFFTYLKENPSVSKTNFYNRETNLSLQFDASLEHNLLEHKLVGPEYIKKIGYNGASLLKKKNGEVIAISIIVPVNEKTLPILATEPVSRAYFGNLTVEEKAYYNVPVEKTAGYFIRYQEYKDPTDNAARSYLLYNLFPLIFLGGKLIASTPLKFFQELLNKFGFQVVPGREHNDYHDDKPTQTYLLDLSGPKLVPYLKQFVSGITKQNELDILTEKYSLTKREQDITNLLLEDKSIADIAKELFIAEITVKKALSRIYKKANVKNRRQLIKKIMDIF
ncbi:LuxR C-terminal-related transcriptional regulator [Ornithinibacillus sp. 179-J 7C1 HS]|uniref:LuxR C-terminal-related transcriptional regulator n=1 Tax=Ornithinibacillus sp. 179-J 7C1 HS TaxID=3142384 RepID=UPI0039A09BA7